MVFLKQPRMTRKGMKFVSFVAAFAVFRRVIFEAVPHAPGAHPDVLSARQIFFGKLCHYTVVWIDYIADAGRAEL
jgi:hypothetical protein